MTHQIEYSPDAENHLKGLTTHQRAIVIDQVEQQLTHQPMCETRNRKPMRPNSIAPWELRIGRLRVYYDVDKSPDAVVRIRAVGVKERTHVGIGTEVVQL